MDARFSLFGHLTQVNASLVVGFASTCESILVRSVIDSPIFDFLQNKLLRQCLEHVEACRDLRKKIGIGGLCNSQKGSRNNVLCLLS